MILHKENFLQNLHFFLYYINFSMHTTDSNSFFLLSSFLCSCNELQKKKWTFCELFLCFSGEFYLALFGCVSHFNPDFYSKIVWFTSSITTDFDFLLFIFPIYHGADPPHLIHCILIAKLPSTDSLFFSSRI